LSFHSLPKSKDSPTPSGPFSPQSQLSVHQAALVSCRRLPPDALLLLAFFPRFPSRGLVFLWFFSFSSSRSQVTMSFLRRVSLISILWKYSPPYSSENLRPSRRFAPSLPAFPFPRVQKACPSRGHICLYRRTVTLYSFPLGLFSRYHPKRRILRLKPLLNTLPPSCASLFMKRFFLRPYGSHFSLLMTRSRLWPSFACMPEPFPISQILFFSSPFGSFPCTSRSVPRIDHSFCPICAK